MLTGMSISLMFHQSRISYRSYRMLACEKCCSCCVSFRNSNATDNFVKKKKGTNCPWRCRDRPKIFQLEVFMKLARPTGVKGRPECLWQLIIMGARMSAVTLACFPECQPQNDCTLGRSVGVVTS